MRLGHAGMVGIAVGNFSIQCGCLIWQTPVVEMRSIHTLLGVRLANIKITAASCECRVPTEF